MSPFRNRRRLRRRNQLLAWLYNNPASQYLVTIISAILLAGFIFSGVLVFRYADESDLINRSKRLLAEGKVAWAVQNLENLVARYDTSYNGYILLGKAYLELGERTKAERAFMKAASLRSSDLAPYSQEMAMSKLLIVRQEYDKAEQNLLMALRKDHDNPEIQEALYELYSDWGDSLMANPDTRLEAIGRFERAIRYANRFDTENKIKDKLMLAIRQQVDSLKNGGQSPEAIILLKKSLRFRYLPETLLELAEIHEATGDLDSAIYWYRKAFDASPEAISVKLTDMLVKKGRQFLDEKKPDVAARFFAEADRISSLAKIPKSILFPVKLADVQLVAKVNYETGTITPSVKGRVTNYADRPLPFLILRADFTSQDRIIEEQTLVVTDPDTPLAPQGSGKSSKDFVIELKSPIDLTALAKRNLQVKIYTAYQEGDLADWKLRTFREVAIPNRQEPKPAVAATPTTEADTSDRRKSTTTAEPQNGSVMDHLSPTPVAPPTTDPNAAPPPPPVPN
jgi:tetratricopeptide (TPR) repeat protein